MKTRERRRLSILFSFGTPHAKSNPFLPLLLESLADGAEVHTFSWQFAFFGRYDVLHFHWPEHWFQQSHGWRLLVRIALVRLLLLRTDILGTLIAATAHNIAPHEKLSPRTARNLARITRRVDLWIVLNPFTPTPPGSPAVTIPHGHYRDWYSERVPGGISDGGVREDILFTGFIRPYKGVEQLIREYRAAGNRIPLKLQIMGTPHSQALADELRALAAGDDTITLRLEHVPDASLRDQILRSALIVLPYRTIHNSGVALLALSLNRPILVPDNEVTRELQREFGSDYVHLFEESLSADRLTAVVSDITSIDWEKVGAADMSHREWPEIGRQHLSAYENALSRCG